MELEQIKSIWQQDKPATSKKDEQLLLLLNTQSRNPIARMKRNVMVELIAVILLYGVAIIFYFVAFHGRMREASWFMIVIGMFFFIYYYRKNKLLNGMECLTCHVRSNLQRQVNTLEKYVRFYLVAGTILIPVTLLFFTWLIYSKFPFKPVSILFPGAGYAWWLTATVWLLIIGASSFLSYFLNKWYVNKLYGKHIQKLKSLLTELNEE